MPSAGQKSSAEPAPSPREVQFQSAIRIDQSGKLRNVRYKQLTIARCAGEMRCPFSKLSVLGWESAQASPFSAPSHWAAQVKLQIACSYPLPLITPAKARLPSILD